MSIDVAAVAISIMPREPLPLAGYTERDKPFYGVASEIEASIVMFGADNNRVAIIGLDTLFASAALEEAIRRHLADSSLTLILVATHTHFAPSLDDQKPALGIVAPAYLAQVGRSVAEAIGCLCRKMTPATCSYAHARAAGAIYRRRYQPMASRRFPFVTLATAMAPNTKAKTPDAMQVAIIGDVADPRAVIWSWPCHAVASPDRMSISADFPGEVRALLRRHFGNLALPIIYLPGFCGDIRPDTRGTRWTLRNLAYNILLPLSPFTSMSADAYATFCSNLATRLISTIALSVSTDFDGGIYLDRQDFDIGGFMAPQQDATIRVRSLVAGSLSFLFVGAEVCSPYYRLLDHRPEEPSFVTGCAGPVFGYLPTARQVKRGGYEVSGFLPAFGFSGRFTRRFQEAFLKTVKQVSRWPRPSSP